MPGLFTRDEIIEALHALTDVLVRRQVRANIQLVGGSAIALHYDETYESTRDVDAALGASRDEIKDAAAVVAEERGYRNDWLSDAAEAFIPTGGAHEQTVFIARDGVTISVASAPTILAMKLRAGRPNRDFEHIEALLQRTGLSSVAEVESLYEQHYPGDTVASHVRDWLRRHFGDVT